MPMPSDRVQVAFLSPHRKPLVPFVSRRTRALDDTPSEQLRRAFRNPLRPLSSAQVVYLAGETAVSFYALFH